MRPAVYTNHIKNSYEGDGELTFGSMVKTNDHDGRNSFGILTSTGGTIGTVCILKSPNYPMGMTRTYALADLTLIRGEIKLKR